MRTDVFIERECVLDRFKQTDDVCFFGGAEFHTGNDEHVRGLPHLYSGGRIAAGIVIRKRDDVAAEQRCHIDEVVRRHVRIAARRKARVQVQVVPIAVHTFTPVMKRF